MFHKVTYRFVPVSVLEDKRKDFAFINCCSFGFRLSSEFTGVEVILEYWEVNPPFANRQQIKENLVLSRPYLLPNYHGTSTVKSSR